MKQSGVAAICRSAIEAGLILAVIVVPLYFDPYAFRRFEASKIYPLQSILFFLGAVLVVKLADRIMSRGFAFKGTVKGFLHYLRETPLTFPVVCLIASQTMSTLFSVAPNVSLAGSHLRSLGLWTHLLFAAVFFIALLVVKAEKYFDRVIDAVLFASVPVSLFAIAQNYWLVVFGAENLSITRVDSTMGNPIYLGAYGIMIIPIALSKTIEAFRFSGEPKGRRPRMLFITAGYGLITIVNVISVFLTQSRGPLIGLAVGLFFFFFIGLLYVARSNGEGSPFAAGDIIRACIFAVATMPVGVIPGYVLFLLKRKGLRWLWIAFLVQTILFSILFGLLAGSKGFSEKIRGVPVAGRFVDVHNLKDPTVMVRLFLWDGASNVLDSSSAGRLLAGYGPEMVRYIWARHAPPGTGQYIPRTDVVDSVHNEILDRLIETGVPGFCAYFFFWISVFYFGLKYLGFIRGRRERNLFVYIATVAVLAGFFVPRLAAGTYRLSGLSAALFFLIGTVIYVLSSVKSFFRAANTAVKDHQQGHSIIVLGLFAALAGRFVDAQFSVAIIVPIFLSFVFSALLAGKWLTKKNNISTKETHMYSETDPGESLTEMVKRDMSKRGKKKRASSGPRKIPLPSQGRGYDAIILPAITVSFALFVLGYGFVVNPFEQSGIVGIVGSSLTNIKTASGSVSSFALPLVLLVTALSGALLIVVEREKSNLAGGKLLPMALTIILYGAIVVAYTAVTYALQAFFVNPEIGPGYVHGYFFVVLFITGCVLTVWMVPPEGAGHVGWKAPLFFLAPAACAVALVIFGTIYPILADTYHLLGDRAENTRRFSAAHELYRRAMDYSPEEGLYRFSAGQAMMAEAIRTGGEQQRDHLLQSAIDRAMEAHRKEPLNVYYTGQVGLIYAHMASFARSDQEKAHYFARAHEWHEKSMALSPVNPLYLNRWARVHVLQGNLDRAMEMLDRSKKLDPHYVDTDMMLAEIAFMQGRVDESTGIFLEAVANYPATVKRSRGLVRQFVQKGQARLLEQALSKKMREGPAMEGLYRLVAVLAIETGTIESAVERHKKILAADADNLDAALYLVFAYDMSNAAEEKLHIIDKTIALAQQKKAKDIETMLTDMRKRSERELKKNPHRGT